MTPPPPSSAPHVTPSVGTWLSTGSPVIAELAALSGFDWLLLDLEHGAGSEGTLLANLQAIRGTAARPIVRVGAPHPDLILRALDWGAAGIMVPHVESAAQAKDCLQAMHYPPRGLRGLSRSARVYDYGLRPLGSVPPPLFFAQIESLRGIEHVAEIAALEGVDVLFVGPADLAQDLSICGGHAPAYDDCLIVVADAAHRAGKAAGILVRNLDDLPRLRSLGYTHIALESDVAILRHRYRMLLALAREPESPSIAQSGSAKPPTDLPPDQMPPSLRSPAL